MARLPIGQWLIQQIGHEVVLFHADTEEEVCRFNPADVSEAGAAQKQIADSDLGDTDKAMAHFWSGYFFAHATQKGKQ